MSKVYEYVTTHAIRGACQCGRCFDAPADPTSKQPTGHTANLVFFKVAAKDANADEFRTLVAVEFPHWLDGQEHSYLETGADIGEQGAALMAMGLGAVLGTWDLLTPAMLPLPDETQMLMAKSGYVSIQARAAR